jgi:hypothetical protein
MKIEIPPWNLSDNNGIEVKLIIKETMEIFKHMWTSNMLLSDQWIIEEMREEVKKFLIKLKTQPTKTYRIQQSQC